jgi:hypothetical protein
MESWELFSRAVGDHHESRATMLRLKEAEAPGQGDWSTAHSLRATPLALRTELARQ